MPIIKQVIQAEIDPSKPVQEVCDVLSAVLKYHRATDEEAILQGISDAIHQRLDALKGVEKSGKPIREPRRNETDKG